MATSTEMMFPTYNSTITDTFLLPPTKYVTVKSDSGLTHAHLPVVSGKRTREDDNNSINMNQYLNNYHSSASSFTFIGQDFSSQIHQDQLQVDRFIVYHMEKVRLEMDERRRKYSRRMMNAVEESVGKKLKGKEEEIEKIKKVNADLVDRVESLYVENQVWRDLAQTNEATATALRSNLEQVLAQVQDDASSCCGSNYNEDEESRHCDNSNLCRSCGKEEACVLLLPCRHLCLCNGCGSYLHICPVCKSSKSCSLHVNLST